MSNAQAKAELIRESYLKEEQVTSEAILLDEEFHSGEGLNLKRYSIDGHSWNNKPYICRKNTW